MSRGWQSEVETAAQLQRMRWGRTQRRRDRRRRRTLRAQSRLPEQRVEELRRSNLRSFDALMDEPGVEGLPRCRCYIMFDPDCPVRVND